MRQLKPKRSLQQWDSPIGRNVLRFDQSASLDEQFAAAAAQAARACLDEHSVQLSEIDMIVAAPARPGYRAALSSRLGVEAGQISVAEDQRMHTAALAAAFGPAGRAACGRARRFCLSPPARASPPVPPCTASHCASELENFDRRGTGQTNRRMRAPVCRAPSGRGRPGPGRGPG